MWRPRQDGPLFGNAVAHRADPVTSHDAAAKVTASGARQRHADIVLATLDEHPDCTAPELARKCGLEEYQVRRRLTDLLQAGAATQGQPRACRVKGSRMVTWRAL